MHTSVEKHSLRIAESCGTLAHASRFLICDPTASHLRRNHDSLGALGTGARALQSTATSYFRSCPKDHC
jgi:hypothetical protein